MPQFCKLFYANYTILATQRGDHGIMPSPKYVPAWTYRTNVLYFNLIFKAYRTNVQYPDTRTTAKKAYRTSIPYFLAKIEAHRTVLPSLLSTTRNFNWL